MTLRLVPRRIEVIVLKRKPLAERLREGGPDEVTLRSGEDWRQFGQLVFGDDRLAGPVPDPEKRGGVCPPGSNVIQLRLPKRRSSSAEIHAVRVLEERRGKR